MMWTVNKCEGNHHWCQWFPRYPSTISWVRIDDLMSNTKSNISIKGQWCEPMPRARESVIKAYRSQGTKFLFLRLFPGWWANVDRNSLIEGGTWWIPHRRNETWNKLLEFWIQCNHWTDSKGIDTKVVLTAEVNFQLPFEHRVAWQKAWQH